MAIMMSKLAAIKEGLDEYAEDMALKLEMENAEQKFKEKVLFKLRCSVMKAMNRTSEDSYKVWDMMVKADDQDKPAYENLHNALKAKYRSLKKIWLVLI